MKKNNIRYWISKGSIYIFIYCALFLIQRALLCTLFDIKKYVIFNKLYAYEPILAIITYVEVRKCIKIENID